jgi:tRNA G10  N-methylase Trm11
MSEAPILAADYWPTNAELIEAVATLYIKPEDQVLDMTYGRGTWWKKYRPEKLLTNDLDESTMANFHDDFRDLGWKNDSFDVVAFDPPYVSVGGRKTSTLGDYHARYGLVDAPTTPEGVQRLIGAGLAEAHRVLKPKGVALVKCQDYITSGRYWAGTHYTLEDAESLGFVIEDRFEHLAKSPRPQPPGRRQVHARRNLSTLIVLRKRAEGKRGP